MNELKAIQKIIYHSPPFTKLTGILRELRAGESLSLQKAEGSLFAFIVAGLFELEKRQIVVVASDRDKAEKLRDDCAMLLGQSFVLYFGERPSHDAALLDLSSPLSQIETLQSLAKKERQVIIASPNSICQRVPKPETFVQKILELVVGEEHNFQELLRQLAEFGFEKKNFVESYGDFAVRGGILDVFSFTGENPLRLEFWGNTIESIREFDVLSQRSIKKLEKATVVPSLHQLDSTESGALEQQSKYSASLFDYLESDALLLFDEPEFIKREFDELVQEQIPDVFSYDEMLSLADNFVQVFCSALPSSDLVIGTGNKGGTINFGALSQPSLNGSVNRLVESINTKSAEGYAVHVMCDTKNEAERLNELIEDVLTEPEKISSFLPDDSLHPNEMETIDSEAIESNVQSSRPEPSSFKCTFVTGAIHNGFIFPQAKIVLFTEHEVFGRLKRRGVAKRKRFKSFSQKELQQLKPGDFVVHVDRGIGMFSTMQKITVAGVEQEVMKLQYDEGGIMYVNLNMLNRVQKYSSKEGFVPKLNKLGSGDWEKVTSKAKKRIKDIARDLIKLYAKRKLEEGYAFNPDSHWQKELEASFMYEDTPDQARTTQEVKNDMESASPMDRLVCGDVGFGKTEVAVRATFKAVSDGKQVAVLVPTTILAMQHYNTFLDRLSKYTVRVEHLTRFKSAKEQKIIVEGVNRGSVDVIIGTHRLLSKDIGFKDLGLLIVDEEHRFGVSAKEKLRRFRASVDTLALTATPIPRTLQFSLLGARDLSIIATPPRNRLPIQTEIIPAGTDGHNAHWQIIREAIVHELHRGGQVYVVHDRVENIESIAEMVRSKVPEAKVHVAHGQMQGHELEQTMLDFLEKKYDVLVCTKIIESGLDIPSVNTIIVNRADRFGMAELHQLRGRVGRSNVQAYAYLLTPPFSVLPKPTLRRLQAIGEFTELGSGFNLSMRDLEIRGAGNLLGAEQSGFVADMGFEMYEQILREAVEELKQEEFNELFKESAQTPGVQTATPEIQTLIETELDAYIPDFYIESSIERLDFYRRLTKTKTEPELQEMREELKDRFGEYPDVVENLFIGVEFRILGTKAHFQKIELIADKLIITLPVQTDLDFYEARDGEKSRFESIVALLGRQPKGAMKIVQDEKDLKIVARILNSSDGEGRVKEAKNILRLLCG